MKYGHIDAIRGLAILMVMFVHAAQVTGVDYIPHIVPAYGSMGVQLFFVASAFTLCLSADVRKNEEYAFVKYAIRRYFRIAPAYYIGILGYFALSVVVKWAEIETPTFAGDYSAVNVLCNVLLIHGFVPSANNSIVPGGWSVGTEVAFYLIFPALFSVFSACAKSGVKGILLLWGGLFSAALIAIGVTCLVSGRPVVNNSFLYFSLLNQAPVFITGVGYYFLWREKALGVRPVYSGLLFCGMSLVAVSLWAMRGTAVAFFLVPFVAGVSFVFLMELFRTVSALSPLVLQRIGRASYSMYLIHFVFIYIFPPAWSAKMADTMGRDLSFFLLFFAITAVTFVLADRFEEVVVGRSIALGKSLVNKLPVARAGAGE